MEYDVVIAGFGPTGATLAGLLGRRGIRVAICDKLPDLFPLPRAIGLDHEVMRLMQELGVASKMQQHVAAYRPTEYHGMDGQVIKRLDMAPPPHRLGWAPNYVFNQPAMEGVLRKRLSEMGCVHTFLEANVLDHGQEADRAWIDVVLKGDVEPTRIAGKYLVAADGGASPIRTRMGIALEDLDFHEPWLVVDVVVNEAKLAELPQTQVQYCEAGRPSTYVVLPGNHRRWEIMLNPGDSVASNFPDSELWPLLSRWIKPSDGHLWRSAAYRFHGLVANEWRRERILLAGDAAHMTPPFMAQGMVQGLRDAANLAWKLQLVLQGSSPDALLDSYFEERRLHVLQTTTTAIELGRVICERDPALARQRDARLLADQGGAVQTIYRQNMIPDLKHGIIAVDTPGAGSLFPQPKVRAADFEGLLDDYSGCKPRVLVRGVLDAQLASDFDSLLQPIGGVLMQFCHAAGSMPAATALQFEEVEPVMGPWLDTIRQSVVVARPDGYVYGTATTPQQGYTLIQRFIRDLKDAGRPEYSPDWPAEVARS